MINIYFVVFLLELAAILFLLVNLGGIMTWVERKESALIQDRIGANRAGREFERWPLKIFRYFPLNILPKLGLLHPLADGLKMFTKERFAPNGAGPLYYIAPFLAVMPAMLTFMVIPFGPDLSFGINSSLVNFWNALPWVETIDQAITIPLQVLRIDGGILYIFAFAGLGVYSAALAGWASGNKFAILGSIRASAQMISYEIAMGISLVGLFMVFGSVQLNEIVAGQGELLFGVLPKWGVFLQPLSFVIFFTAAIAETKRAPFDLAEGESEIVAGYFLEYSGMHFGAFYMAEFVEIVVVSAIVSTLFFGGWHIPYLTDQGFMLPGAHTVLWQMDQLWVTVLRVCAFFAKVFFFAWFQVLLRWSLPRFRFDQVISLGWKVLFPAALINVLITAFILAAL